jgi:aspartyl-tRNA(Asn)/glutamyl-tRNA(Gln) amidotransferase subunit C
MNASKILKDEVRHLANLVKIKLTEEEIEKYQTQFTSILEYIDQLNEVDTKNIEPFEWMFSQKNPLRPDQVRKGLTREKALENSKNKSGKFFAVPTVVTK